MGEEHTEATTRKDELDLKLKQLEIEEKQRALKGGLSSVLWQTKQFGALLGAIGAIVVMAFSLNSNIEKLATTEADLEKAGEDLAAARKEMMKAESAAANAKFAEPLAAAEMSSAIHFKKDAKVKLEELKAKRAQAMSDKEEAERATKEAKLASRTAEMEAKLIKSKTALARANTNASIRKARASLWKTKMELGKTESIAARTSFEAAKIQVASERNYAAAVSTLMGMFQRWGRANEHLGVGPTKGDFFSDLERGQLAGFLAGCPRFERPLKTSIQNAMALRFDGSSVRLFRDDGSITTWATTGDPETWQVVEGARQIRLPPDSAAKSFAQRGKTWLILTHDGKLFQDAEPITIIDDSHKRPIQAFPTSIAVHGRRLAIGTLDGRLLIIDLHGRSNHDELNVQWHAREHIGEVSALSFASEEELVTVGADGRTCLWTINGAGLQLNEKVRAHNGYIVSLAINGSTHRVATAGIDKSIRIWHLEDLAETMSLVGHHREIGALAFGPKGVKLASQSWDGTVRVWDLTRPTDPLILTHTVPNSSRSLSVAFGQSGQDPALACLGFEAGHFSVHKFALLGLDEDRTKDLLDEPAPGKLSGTNPILKMVASVGRHFGIKAPEPTGESPWQVPTLQISAKSDAPRYYPQQRPAVAHWNKARFHANIEPEMKPQPAALGDHVKSAPVRHADHHASAVKDRNELRLKLYRHSLELNSPNAWPDESSFADRLKRSQESAARGEFYLRSGEPEFARSWELVSLQDSPQGPWAVDLHSRIQEWFSHTILHEFEHGIRPNLSRRRRALWQAAHFSTAMGRLTEWHQLEREWLPPKSAGARANRQMQDYGFAVFGRDLDRRFKAAVSAKEPDTAAVIQRLQRHHANLLQRDADQELRGQLESLARQNNYRMQQVWLTEPTGHVRAWRIRAESFLAVFGKFNLDPKTTTSNSFTGRGHTILGDLDWRPVPDQVRRLWFGLSGDLMNLGANIRNPAKAPESSLQVTMVSVNAMIGLRGERWSVWAGPGFSLTDIELLESLDATGTTTTINKFDESFDNLPTATVNLKLGAELALPKDRLRGKTVTLTANARYGHQDDLEYWQAAGGIRCYLTHNHAFSFQIYSAEYQVNGDRSQFSISPRTPYAMVSAMFQF